MAPRSALVPDVFRPHTLHLHELFAGIGVSRNMESAGAPMTAGHGAIMPARVVVSDSQSYRARGSLAPSLAPPATRCVHPRPARSE